MELAQLRARRRTGRQHERAGIERDIVGGIGPAAAVEHRCVDREPDHPAIGAPAIDQRARRLAARRPATPG